jgi:hypothetical protein
MSQPRMDGVRQVMRSQRRSTNSRPSRPTTDEAARWASAPPARCRRDAQERESARRAAASATQCSATGGHSLKSDRDEGPWYLLLNGTEPRWRLHDTVDSADLEASLARVMENGVIIYTLASRNEGETFQSLAINGKNLMTYVITEEADPDPPKTRSRHQAAGF